MFPSALSDLASVSVELRNPVISGLAIDSRKVTRRGFICCFSGQRGHDSLIMRLRVVRPQRSYQANNNIAINFRQDRCA